MAWRRLDAEMRIDDGAELVGRLEAGHERGGRVGRHRKDDGVLAARARWSRCRSRAHRPGLREKRMACNWWPRRTVALRSAQAAPARARSSVWLRPSRAISGRQALPPAASVSRTTAPASAADPSGGSMLSAASKQRPHQPLVDDAVEADDLADRLVACRPQQPRQRQIVERLRARNALAGIENPPRQRAGVEAQRPALAGGEVEKGKFGGRRADQPVLRRRCCADRRARNDCRTAADDCRCRSSCRPNGRDRSGSGRRRLVASCTTTVSPRAVSSTAAERPARPAPMMWMVRGIR